MVTTILKMLFITNESIPHGVVNFANLLPRDFVALYLDYYAMGSGYVVLAFVHLITICSAIFSSRTYLRVVSKLFIVISIILYSTGISKVIVNTLVPLNSLGLPIPRFPVAVFFLLCFWLVFIQFWEIRKYLRLTCRKSVLQMVDIVSLVLLAIFMLPILTGELWYA